MSMGNKVMICKDKILGLPRKIRKVVISMGSKVRDVQGHDVKGTDELQKDSGLDGVCEMHHNELFESYSTKEGVVLKDIGDVYRALDIGLHDGGSVKHKGRPKLLLR